MFFLSSLVLVSISVGVRGSIGSPPAPFEFEMMELMFFFIKLRNIMDAYIQTV